MDESLDLEARAALEEEIGEMDGVLHASVDTRDGIVVWVVRDPSFDAGPMDLAVRNRLAALGHDPTGMAVRVTLPTEDGERRRVRFESVNRSDDGGRVTVTVTLEWDGTQHSGAATGERGPAIELKTTAQAAVRALEDLAGQTLDLRIIGVKAIHAFDSDLMVASLFRSAGVAHRLVGAVVVADDPLAASAVAVLSAVNRTMGNFLETPD